MRAGARIAAAAEVLDDILNRHRPAATALADWGKAHRFAGSGDRAAIGTLVFDALRRRSSIAARMGADTPRALALGAAPRAFGMTPDEVAPRPTAPSTPSAPLTRRREGRPRRRRFPPTRRRTSPATFPNG